MIEESQNEIHMLIALIQLSEAVQEGRPLTAAQAKLAGRLDEPEIASILEDCRERGRAVLNTRMARRQRKISGDKTPKRPAPTGGFSVFALRLSQ